MFLAPYFGPESRYIYYLLSTQDIYTAIPGGVVSCSGRLLLSVVGVVNGDAMLLNVFTG